MESFHPASMALYQDYAKAQWKLYGAIHRPILWENEGAASSYMLDAESMIAG